MRNILSLIFIITLTTPLFAIRDKTYIGLSYETADGKATTDAFTDTKTKYDLTGDATAARFGWVYNYDREHLYKGRVEFSYAQPSFTYKQNSTTEYDVEGDYYGLGLFWGRHFDTMLNGELTPMVKFHYGFYDLDKIKGTTEIGLGLALFFSTRYVELSVGVDTRKQDWKSWAFDVDIFRAAPQSNTNAYIQFNYFLD